MQWAVAAAAGEEPAQPLFEADARADRIGRVLVPVLVNGHGPFQFVLDTGANRTVLTPRLVDTLGLEIAAKDHVTLSGVTGSASVPTVLVDHLKVGDVELKRERLPVADSLSEDTQGILGVDALAGTRIVIDFVRSRIQIRKARHEGLMDGLTRVPAECRFRRLLMIKASVGRIPVSAVIDTGSQYTLGNAALREKLGLPSQRAASKLTDVIGETLARQVGERRLVPVLRMGSAVQVARPAVIFGDFHVFKLWRLESQPAVVVGMDMIGTLGTLLIDYQRCEIQVRTRVAG
jgi:aspartyl protease